MTDDLEALRSQLKETNTNISEMRKDIGKIETNIAVLAETSQRTPDRCPLRVEIARAGNGAVQAQARAEAAIKLAEKAVDLTVENRVGITKLAAMAAGGGVSGGLVISIIQYLMQLQ